MYREFIQLRPMRLRDVMNILDSAGLTIHSVVADVNDGTGRIVKNMVSVSCTPSSPDWLEWGVFDLRDQEGRRVCMVVTEKTLDNYYQDWYKQHEYFNP